MGLYQQDSSRWRHRETSNREFVRKILCAPNPIFEPPPQQFPRPWPPMDEQTIKRVRNVLYEQSMASGDPVVMAFARAWLAPDPMDEVREVVQDFLDHYPGYPVPHYEAPEPPPYNPYQYVKMEES
jgi:hypothetical protein